MFLNSVKEYLNDDEINKIFEKYRAEYDTERFIIRYRIDVPDYCK